jgi:hypothetical protein
MNKLLYARPSFTLNHYDEDGDMVDMGVYLNIGPASFWAARDVEAFQGFVDHCQKIADELKATYPNTEHAD